MVERVPETARNSNESIDKAGDDALQAFRVPGQSRSGAVDSPTSGAPEPHDSILGTFAGAAWRTAVENPILSMRQLTEGTDVAFRPEKPQQPTMALRWADSLGQTAGMLFDLMAVSKASGLIVSQLVKNGITANAGLRIMTGSTLMPLPVAAAGLGFFNGTALTPLQKGESNWKRVDQGIVDALTFGTMSAAHHYGLTGGIARALGKAPDVLGNTPLVQRGLFATAQLAESGFAGGFVNGYLDAKIHDRPATLSEDVARGLDFAIGNILMGGAVRTLGAGANKWNYVRQKDQLVKRASAVFSEEPGKADRFKGLMAEFEERVGSDKIRADSYTELRKILGEDPNNRMPVKLEIRALVAQQALRHAADPTTIHQGKNNTCAPHAIETLGVAPRHPAEYLRAIADPVTTGEFVTRDGIKVDAKKLGILDMDQEARGALNQPFNPHNENDLIMDGHRSLASSIFRRVAVNTHYLDQENIKIEWNNGSYWKTIGGPDSHPRGAYRYTVQDGEEGLVGPGIGDAPGKPAMIDHPQLKSEDLAAISNRFTAEGERNIVVNKSKELTVSDLASMLRDAKNNGRLPLIAAVDAYKEPFATQLGRVAQEGKSEGHAVVITDIKGGADPSEIKVSISSYDDLTLTQLFKALFEGDSPLVKHK